MPAIFLILRGIQAAKILKSPLFKALKPATQAGIKKNLAKSAVKGAAARVIVLEAIGIVVDPYNRILVPLTGGILLTTDETVDQVLSGDITPHTGLSVAVNLSLDPLGLAIEVTGRAITTTAKVIIHDVKVVTGEISRLTQLALEKLN